jgi:RNA polymerase sigma-70 factor (ECF subfamily)
MTMPLAEDYDADQPVVEAIREGDKFAFEDLVRRHGAWVRSVVFGVLGDRDYVDDVVQQVWTTVWRRVGDLKDTRRWRSWLYRLTRNAALDTGRDVTRRREQLRSLLAEARPESGASPSLAHQDRTEHYGAVLDAIKALPALYREPFVLRHVNGWSYREIAGVMEMPVDSIETRLVRARRMLREALKGKLE